MIYERIDVKRFDGDTLGVPKIQDVIKILMVQNGLNQTTLADKASVDRKAVNRFLTGATDRLNEDGLEKIAAALGTTAVGLNELVTGQIADGLASVRLRTESVEKLGALAEEVGLTQSEVIRQLVVRFGGILRQEKRDRDAREALNAATSKNSGQARDENPPKPPKPPRHPRGG